MTAPHFFAADVSGEKVLIHGDDARHALRVLRLRLGERITISDGRGEVVRAVVEADRDVLVASVLERRYEPPARPSLEVFQAIPKKGKLDLVVQKLTELGAASIRLLVAERSVPRWDAAKGNAHTTRLGEVARQAAMQSRRAWLPSILAPVPASALDLPSPTVVLDETAETRLTDALGADAPATVGLVVGPEGGFTADELATFRERGATPVSLGPMILRTETAALAAAAVVLGRYRLLG